MTLLQRITSPIIFLILRIKANKKDEPEFIIGMYGCKRFRYKNPKFKGEDNDKMKK